MLPKSQSFPPNFSFTNQLITFDIISDPTIQTSYTQKKKKQLNYPAPRRNEYKGGSQSFVAAKNTSVKKNRSRKRKSPKGLNKEKMKINP